MTMRNPIDCLPLPSLYYQPQPRDYYRKDSTGKWISINEENAKRYLVAQGYHRSLPKDGSEIDQCLLRVQEEQNIAYCGPLAGYKAGRYIISGKTVLIDSSPNLIQPAPGVWPTLQAVFESTLKTETAGRENEQIDCFYSWLANGYKAVNTSSPSPAQVMVVAGPAEAGKSLIQQIITSILGGRSGSPYQSMSAQTQFNKDLFGAEHMVIEDEHESTNIADRQSFGASIKSFAVNHEHRLHAKGKDAINLTPVWRVSVSLNDTPDRLKVLPPLESDIKDKLILLQAYRRGMPMPTGTLEEKTAFWNKLVEEMPAFIDYLMKRPADAPGTNRSRYGVVSYHNPDLLAKIDCGTPEYQLLELIDTRYFHYEKGELVGNAQQIMDKLKGSCLIERELMALVKNSETMGKYLSRLAEKPEYGNRVRKIEARQRNVIYQIKAPTRPQPNPPIPPSSHPQQQRQGG